jgi:hypothetical protein
MGLVACTLLLLAKRTDIITLLVGSALCFDLCSHGSLLGNV